jgi:hypothetical protein
MLACNPPRPAPDRLCHDAADEIERLREALLEIFDYACRTSGQTLIACTARDALWPKGENDDTL